MSVSPEPVCVCVCFVCFPTSPVALPIFSHLQALYVVDPLPWCPHLDAVQPLPHAGLDLQQPCGDCGSDAENWICLTCYQVK